MKRNLFNFIYYVILCHNFNFMVSLSSFVSKPILIHFAVAMIVSNVKIHAISVSINQKWKEKEFTMENKTWYHVTKSLANFYIEHARQRRIGVCVV